MDMYLCVRTVDYLSYDKGLIGLIGVMWHKGLIGAVAMFCWWWMEQQKDLYSCHFLRDQNYFVTKHNLKKTLHLVDKIRFIVKVFPSKCRHIRVYF